MNGPRNVVVVDSKGNVANISTYDVMQSNGVIHVIDRVLDAVSTGSAVRPCGNLPAAIIAAGFT